MSQSLHSRGMGLIQSCCTMRVRAGGTQPMSSICQSVSPPQLLPYRSLTLAVDSSSEVLVAHLRHRGRIQISSLLPTTSNQIVAETCCMVTAWSWHAWSTKAESLQRPSIVCKIQFRDKPCNYSTSWVALERKHKAMNSSEN